MEEKTTDNTIISAKVCKRMSSDAQGYLGILSTRSDRSTNIFFIVYDIQKKYFHSFPVPFSKFSQVHSPILDCLASSQKITFRALGNPMFDHTQALMVSTHTQQISQQKIP